MAKKETVSSKVEHKSEYIWCIQNPRITEKATKLAEGNVYTFDVHKDANKQQVQFAIENLYNVHPTKIRMVTIPSVTVMKKNIIYTALMILLTATAVQAQDTWTRLYPSIEPDFRTLPSTR